MHSQQMVTEAAQDEVVLELRNTKHRGGGFEMTIHARGAWRNNNGGGDGGGGGRAEWASLGAGLATCCLT